MTRIKHDLRLIPSTSSIPCWHVIDPWFVIVVMSNAQHLDRHQQQLGVLCGSVCALTVTVGYLLPSTPNSAADAHGPPLISVRICIRT